MKNKVLKVIVTLVTLLSFSGISWADKLSDLENEIKAMKELYEGRIGKLEAQIADMKKEKGVEAGTPKAAAPQFLGAEYVGRYEGPFKKGGLLIKNPSGFGNVSVGGYADIEYANFQKTTSEFDQHRWIINIGAEFDRLRFYSEYEIEHGGPSVVGGEAHVEQAWMDYLINDWVNVRAGALLVPFGRYNLYHDSDLQDLTDRPIVDRRVIPTTWTEAGAGFFGEFNPVFGEYEDLTIGYEAYVVNGLTDTFSDAGFRGAVATLGSDNNQFKSVVSRIVVSPALGHELGFSGYFGEYDNAHHYITAGAIDWFSSWNIPLEVKGVSFGPLELVGEYAYFNMDAPAETNIAEFATGAYVQVNFHFWPEFLSNTFLGRNFKNPTFTLVGRYNWAKIDDDSDATVGANEERGLVLGLNYRPIESWVFKLEYQINDTENEPLERGGNDGFMASMAVGF